MYAPSSRLPARDSSRSLPPRHFRLYSLRLATVQQYTGRTLHRWLRLGQREERQVLMGVELAALDQAQASRLGVLGELIGREAGLHRRSLRLLDLLPLGHGQF